MQGVFRMSWLQKIAQEDNTGMTIQDISGFIQSLGGVAYLKYVRINGEYRFGDATSFHISHTGLANGEPVESAAFVKIYSEGLSIEGSSSTLNIGSAADDEENLSRLLSIPIRDQYG